MINKFRGKYSFLSNFYNSPLEFEGRTYKTAEHAFQAAKTDLEHEKNGIAGAWSPAQAKKLGKRIQIRKDWDEVKIDVMYNVLQAKFCDKTLKQKLIDTEDQEIIEGNTWGSLFWGMDVNLDIGHNHLGKLLMRLREEFRNL